MNDKVAQTCRICGASQEHRSYSVREMMFGTREVFPYFGCACCGTIQIRHIPDDLSAYYRDNYYSFRQGSRVERFLKTHLARHSFGRFDVVGRLWSCLVGANGAVRAMRRIGARRTCSILDVGSGSGEFLRQLADLGFERLHGIDPHLPQPEMSTSAYSIRRCGLDDVEETFDIVTLNHVFEHLPDPHETLQRVHARLNDGGVAVVRVPLADSEACRTFGVDWVQWDAPRHLFLHTTAGMHRLAAASGFIVDDVVHDSTAFQFWGSEQYQKDVPLCSPESLLLNRTRFVSCAGKLLIYSWRASRCNAACHGDSAAFILKRVRHAGRVETREAGASS